MNFLFALALTFLTWQVTICQEYDENDYHGDDKKPLEVDVGDGYHDDPSYYPPSDYGHGNSYGYGKGQVDCGPLPDIKNGKVEIVPDTKKASIAMYFCDEGFLLYGKRQRVCSYNGKWTGKQPKCIPVDCRYLPGIANGRLILSGTGFRDTATYLCKVGFDLIGERQRKCKEDGEWSGEAPMCSKISCPKLSPPDNGKLFVSGRYPSDIAIYSCKYGFYLDGQRQRECQRTGEWDGSDPTCKKLEPIVSKKTPYYPREQPQYPREQPQYPPAHEEPIYKDVDDDYYESGPHYDYDDDDDYYYY